jgi:hypothetical protein
MDVVLLATDAPQQIRQFELMPMGADMEGAHPMTLSQFVVLAGCAIIAIVAGWLDARDNRRERFIRRAMGRQ